MMIHPDGMPLGGHAYQLLLALLIGIWCAFRPGLTWRTAVRVGAQASFIIAAGVMLFSERRWWPAGWSIVAMLTWVVTGALVAWVGQRATGYFKGLLQRR
jgi:hypothetical protein